jgi:hypothetical protein
MRCGLLLVTMLGFTCGSPLAAQEPRSQPQGLGQLVVADPQSGSPVRLNLARYHVNVVLHPPVALVQIDQSFYNPFDFQQEGTFVFNLPDGASVSRFAMFTTHTQLIEGELIDRARAANIYQSIVDRQRDPAILEQIGGNLFRMRVFPVPARDTKRILLDYTVPLVDQTDGRYTFELPLMSDLEPIGDFLLAGIIRGPTVTGTPASESHSDVSFFGANQGESVGFEFAREAYRPEGTFVLTFQQRPATEPAVRSYTHAKAEANDAGTPKGEKTDSETSCEFLATISPTLLEKLRPERKSDQPPLDVLILADTSALNVHQRAMRRTIRAITEALRQEDRFQLGCVDVGYRALSQTWIAPHMDAAAQVLSAFDREFFLGTMDFEASLRGAFASLPQVEPGRRRCVIYVGDGKQPIEKITPDDIVGRLAPLAEAAKFQFGAVLLSHDPAGRMLLERLAATTGGSAFRIGGSGSLTEPLAWLSAGCPSSVRIINVQAEGVAPDDLFVTPWWDGKSALHVYGRRKSAGKFKLQLTLERDGRHEPFAWQLEARNDPEDLFVGRLWAQRKLDQLRAQETSNPQTAASRVQQIALSQEWTLLNPYTAFLVLENEEDYAKYGVQRSLRRQYWKPEEAVTAVPLVPAAVKEQKVPRPVAKVLTAERFGEILTESREALKVRHPDRANKLLKSVAGSPFAQDSAEFLELRDATRQMVARAELFEKLGPQRGWFDRSRPIGFPTSTHDLVWQFLYGVGAVPADDGQLAALLKPVAPPREEMSLEEFIGWIKSQSELNVLIDSLRVSEEGIAIDQHVSMVLRGVRSMTLQSMLKHVLGPLGLTYVVEGGILKITARSSAGDRLDSRLYPVSDLILSTQAVPYSLLANGELDRELLVQRRIDQKLGRKISVNFEEKPLEEALESLAEEIDDNVVIDRTKISEEGVALDQPITLELRDVSVRQILQYLLEPVQLTTLIENEAILVTTTGAACDKVQTRIHAAQEIVYEIPPELRKHIRSRRPQPNWFGPWGGWGLGGGGIGGFGGGMGRGMMGGGMGGGMMGGSLGGSAGGLADSTAALSEEDEADDVPAPAKAKSNENPTTPDRDESEADDAAKSHPAKQASSEPTGSNRKPGGTTNADEMIDVIETAIQPESWENLSGPGSIMYYPGALGFVVRQTPAVHTELADFLDKLRALPPSVTDQSGLAQVRPNLVGANDIANWDPDLIVDMLINVIQPESWEELSGPGTAAMNATKLTLFVRQTQEVHEEIRNLLTSLRRARYLARRGRIWKAFDVSAGPSFPVALGVTDLPLAAAESSAAAPDPAELKLLEVLAEPLAGEQHWKSISPGRPGLSTVVRIGGGRTEFDLDGRVARIEGEEAAVAYPGLSLVERGPWGTPLRRMIDGRLPWLPHRSRRELARLFTVQEIARNQQSVQLKLVPPEGAPGDELAITVDRKTGLPTLWESRLAGQTVLRLRFSGMRQTAGKPIWTKVVAEDNAGRQIEQWELVSHAALKGEIPPLERGWQNSVVLDLRVQDRAEVPPFVAALQAIRSVDSDGVDRALTAALVQQPRQPLISFLKAWNLAQQPGHEDEIVPLLAAIAGSGARDLIRNMADGAFRHVSARNMHSVLLSIPEQQRTATDWDRLARMAANSGQPVAALAHLKAAIAADAPRGETFDRIRLQIQLLLDAKQLPAALQLAQRTMNRDDIPVGGLPNLVDLFSRSGTRESVNSLIAAALARKSTVESDREQLLTRRAETETGLARWRTLVEAASLLPVDSPARHKTVGKVFQEIAKTEDPSPASALAEETKDRQIGTALLLAQADFEVRQGNSKVAADIWWKLYEEHELPVARFSLFVSHLHRARQHERVISFVEDRLRNGETVDISVIESVLPLAYDAVGRHNDAKRARTTPRPVESRRPQDQRMRGGGGFF